MTREPAIVPAHHTKSKRLDLLAYLLGGIAVVISVTGWLVDMPTPIFVTALTLAGAAIVASVCSFRVLRKDRGRRAR